MYKFFIKSSAVFLALTLSLSATFTYAAKVKQIDDIEKCKPQALAESKQIQLPDPEAQFTYVDFWASWCGPCKLSFPFLNELHNEMGDKKFKIVGISVDKNIKDAKKFLTRTPADFQLAIDSSGNCPTIFKATMPSSFLIDKNGKVLYRHNGFRPSDPGKIRKALNQIMEGQIDA